jgi:hypothetical protein
LNGGSISETASGLTAKDQAVGGVLRDEEVRDGLKLLQHCSDVHLHGIGQIPGLELMR